MKKWLSFAAAAVLAMNFAACSAGVDGVDGLDGANGTTGIDGTDGINGTNGESALHSVVFDAITTPSSTSEKAALRTTTSVTVDGTAQTIGFTKLLATGDVNNGETFGAMKDYTDTVITYVDSSEYICDGTTNADMGIEGSGLDYTSIIQKNDTLYMVSQFECQVGAMYMAELSQNSTTGELSVKDNSLKFISQKDEFGGFVHCAGQTTPWQSHLGSEEYETDANWYEQNANATTGLTGSAYYDDTAKFWGDNATLMSPYYYGWTPEVIIDSNGNSSYTKHYSMGRMSHELSYVMPDNKTVYMSDDGANVGLFMYKADTAMDLSSGTLYAAKWNQKSSANGGSAYITWIELGSANDTEIRDFLDPDSDVMTNDAISFSDIFIEDASANSTSGTCSDVSYTSINTSAGFECLKLQAAANSTLSTDAEILKAAAFLEPRRYAAMLGATTEFNKEEGITFSREHNKLYIAMSKIEKGMLDDGSNDLGGNNDIRLDYNKCGSVYALAVDNDYTAYNMEAIISGTVMSADSDGNTCELDGISSPDNVTYLEGTNILTIGEDTSYHVNNIIWAYNVIDGTLTRILSTPEGAETTSPFWHRNVNGYTYMTAVAQHPDNSTDYAGNSAIGVLGAIEDLQ